MDKQSRGYSDDEEYDFISKKTGLDAEIIELTLWQRCSCEKPWKDQVSTGMLWLDHVSMLPEDSAGNVKREKAVCLQEKTTLKDNQLKYNMKAHSIYA